MGGKETRLPQLSEREQDILQRLSTGLSDQQIADELVLSLNTVKWYNRRIFAKLSDYSKGSCRNTSCCSSRPMSEQN
ncbi:MAG: helix-turn-helix transcriptional regulator [Caldilineaceae bacterium]|nr:helix-turn-helix transcriptional regulator [Caldilineaceae bacterium]